MKHILSTIHRNENMKPNIDMDVVKFYVLVLPENKVGKGKSKNVFSERV